MLVKTALAIVTNPHLMSGVLKTAKRHVEHFLYVQLVTDNLQPLGSLHMPWPKFCAMVKDVYAQAADQCRDVDVRVFLHTLKYDGMKLKVPFPVDMIICDREFHRSQIDHFIDQHVDAMEGDYRLVRLTVRAPDEEVPTRRSDKVFAHSVLGGTFDRLHVAHKLFLSEAALYTYDKLTIGVTVNEMLTHKVLWEIIEPVGVRMRAIGEFLKETCLDLSVDIVPIFDALGPTASDASMEMLMVSEETAPGGQVVNLARQQNGLEPLDLLTLQLMDNPHPSHFLNQPKISSTATRQLLLGSLLKPVDVRDANETYIIGVTGGIASGKTSITERMKVLGAHVINCDLVAHRAYYKGTECYQQVVSAFGNDVLMTNGQIDRKRLGAIVFADNQKMKLLNDIVWPATIAAVQAEIDSVQSSIVVMEAAVLYLAKWEKLCHEIWATILPKHEAIRRVMARNQLTQEQAEERVDAQPSTTFYAAHAHVLFCTMWDTSFTSDQVDAAWEQLLQRQHEMKQILKPKQP